MPKPLGCGHVGYQRCGGGGKRHIAQRLRHPQREQRRNGGRERHAERAKQERARAAQHHAPGTQPIGGQPVGQAALVEVERQRDQQRIEGAKEQQGGQPGDGELASIRCLHDLQESVVSRRLSVAMGNGRLTTDN
jgi:hypothetical protein